MKLDRLLAIIMLLASNRKITAPELAKRFEVSVRTIYRDIDTLNLAGIPVIAYRGGNGGIAVVEGYQLERNLFTTGEVFSVLATLEDIQDTVGDQVIEMAAEKLKSLLSDQQIEQMKQQSREVYVDLRPWKGSRDERPTLKRLRHACRDCRIVRFGYTNRQGETLARTVEPIMTVLRKDAWYLYGFCRFRQDYRVFKLSRVEGLQVLEETFSRHPVDCNRRPWDELWSEEQQMVSLRVRFSSLARGRVMDEFDSGCIIVDEHGDLLMTTDYPEGEWLYSLILSFGPLAEVLGPASVRQQVGSRAAQILQLYSAELDRE